MKITYYEDNSFILKIQVVMIPLPEDKIIDNRNRKNYRGVIMESDFPHNVRGTLERNKSTDENSIF